MMYSSSTLSHDFYQAMIGKPDMTLFGWKQLIEWSLDHACMSPDERREVRRAWEARWEKFLDEAIEEFGEFEGDVDQDKVDKI